MTLIVVSGAFEKSEKDMQVSALMLRACGTLVLREWHILSLNDKETQMMKAEIVKKIRDEFSEETGEKVTLFTAEVILDQLGHAFHERAGAESLDYAVRQDPDYARYLRDCIYKGENRKEIAEALVRFEN